MEALASGAEFAKLIEPQRTIRDDALHLPPPADRANGVFYRIEYAVRAATTAAPVWIEETGCWYAGPDSRPARELANTARKLSQRLGAALDQIA